MGHNHSRTHRSRRCLQQQQLLESHRHPLPARRHVHADLCAGSALYVSLHPRSGVWEHAHKHLLHLPLHTQRPAQTPHRLC